ncbi:hypothetical protein ACR0W7_002428 [Vibrio cholerae]|uniref:hypothetical protein n=1 Tax=Vibrio cholerae TaxID=666 RepID=UPI000893D1E1|nr:hypothetical protein [Vibrio cholerae]OFJ35985.1 hypothetical protein BFX34_01010 [Vibrio cholerae]
MTSLPLNYNDAFGFYSEHINRQELFSLLYANRLKITGSIPSVVWELFGAILTGKLGKDGYGADLIGFEVKSASQTNGSFEYQYHLNTGMSKLYEDMEVDHLFCTYSPDYQYVDVYLVKGYDLRDYFEKWIPEYESNYSDKTSVMRRQRFRKGIPRGVAQRRGELVMLIEDGYLKYTK